MVAGVPEGDGGGEQALLDLADAVLVSSVAVAGNLHTALWSVAAYTVILCFSLFKTGSLSKSIFNAH